MRGIVVSEGIAIGPIYYIKEQEWIPYKKTISASEMSNELTRFEQALAIAESQLEHLQEKTLDDFGLDESRIIQAQRLFIKDPMFVDEVVKRIKEELYSAAFAVKNVMEEIIELFLEIPDEYMKERASDLRDFQTRILQNLLDPHHEKQLALLEPSIVVAKEIKTSELLEMPQDKVLGLIMEKGGITSHTAILARTLGVPALIGVDVEQITTKDQIVLDATLGKIIFEPSAEQLQVYSEKQQERNNYLKSLEQYRDKPAITQDGKKVDVGINISSLEDLRLAVNQYFDGVGLFRTEFLFMNRSTAPTEDEQFEIYKQALIMLKGKPLIVRTLDIGGDKPVSYIGQPIEDNPFLGQRGIRLSLARLDLFIPQIRALLRASQFGNMKILLPMIATRDEVEQTKQLFELVQQQLEPTEGLINIPPIGAMIEVPSAAFSIPELSEVVDFFSIGTNDLVQYVMAVDRLNEKVLNLYNYCQPSVLKIIKKIIDDAHQYGKWVGICGEMASDPKAAKHLVEMGIDELSMDQRQLNQIKAMVNQVNNGIILHDLSK